MVDGAGVIPTSVQAVPHRGLDCALAKRDGGYAIGQRVGVQDQPGEPLDDLFELQLSAFCTAACDTALPTMQPQFGRDSPSPPTETKKLL